MDLDNLQAVLTSKGKAFRTVSIAVFFLQKTPQIEKKRSAKPHLYSLLFEGGHASDANLVQEPGTK